jgi:hypothetical protein
MKLSPTRTGLFLAISALLASHGAWAQTAQQQPDPPPAAQAPEGADVPTQLDAVQVQGEYIPEPMARTAEVAQFVTREDFSRTGDSDAAAALTRVTGLSLVQDKFVYVRGLGERYSSALLNGSPLPSPEPLQRVVPLDLFPSSVLQGITVQKTYSVRYPGEFGGGVIDLQALTTPETPFLMVYGGVGGNSETTGKSGLTYYGSEDDWSGYDDGTRDMPSALREAIATGRRVDAGAFSEDELKRIGRSFVNAPLNLIQQKDDLSADFSVGGSAGYTAELEDARVGFIAVAGFENKWRNRLGQTQEGRTENGVIVPKTFYDYQSTQNDTQVNVLVGIAAELGEDHKIGMNTLYVHDTTKEARSREGFDELAGRDVRDDFTEWFERELVNHQLAGTHFFGEYRDLELEWRAAYAKASRDAPYEKGIRYRRVSEGVYEHDASQEQNYTRFSTVDDRVVSGGLDLTWRLPTEREFILSGGLAYSDNDRDAESREFRFLALNGPLPESVRRQRIDFLLSDYNISQGLLTLRETTGADGAAAYDATLKVKAAYLQAETEIVPLVRATFGVRYEDATQAVRPIDLFGSGATLPSAAPLRNDYLLPAATITWNFAENQQLRLGASETIGRPQFRELAPQQYFDTELDRLFIGNPYLVDTELRNLDLRYEWFFAKGEYFTVAAFHKTMERPVEAVVNEAGATLQQTFINAPEATLYGLELDFKKYFDLPIGAEWWGDNRLYVAANYTYSKSEIGVEPGDVVYPLAGAGAPRPATDLLRDGAQLQGQSEHIGNLQLGIEGEQSGLQATLIANFVGERISARGRPGQPDFIQEPGTTVDLVVRKGFELVGTDFTLAFEARNLFGQDYEEYQELGGGRVIINQYDLGTTLSLSLTASF